MMMPSIALPTGPYDWHPERNPRAVYEARVEQLRAAMARRGVTHTIVHGNIFDQGALRWLTHFTPKLGPAYALVLREGPLRVLFSGGPGMKPSAQKLTWVEDLAALRSIEADARRWLDETAKGSPVRLGLVEGTAMLRGDWRAVQRASSGSAVELDADLDDIRATSQPFDPGSGAAGTVLIMATAKLRQLARPGTDLRAAVIEMERDAYAKGAEDVRVRIARTPGGKPITLPDETLPMAGPTEVAIALRYHGAWAEMRLVLEPAR